LQVNASTVARAYVILEHEGVIETHKRRGTFVAADAASAELNTLRQMRLRQSVERMLVETLAQGYSLDEIDGAFGLQVAAWRERRQQPAVLEPQPAGNRLHYFAGSHDLALEALWTQARRSHPADAFSVRYVGSLDGLLHLLRGDAALAGAHMLDEDTGQYNVPILRRLFLGQRLCVVTLAEREQGLIVAPGNPKSIHSLHNVARPDVRFVNRQPGSGTRTLLDYHLRQLHVSPRSVLGYSHEVSTHTAVADAVARGAADAGLGLRAAAEAFGMDFVPLARERYDLVTLAESRAIPPISWLLDSINTPAFKAVVASMGGYDVTHTGKEVQV
jgi:putative molybdopterin biosynthesis protein